MKDSKKRGMETADSVYNEEMKAFNKSSKKAKRSKK